MKRAASAASKQGMRTASLLLGGFLSLLFAAPATAGGQEAEVPDCVRAAVEATHG